MIHRFRILATCLTIAALLGVSPVALAAPTLAKLYYTLNGKAKSTNIPDKTGRFLSPAAKVPQSTWLLANGEARSGSTRPSERVLRLYHVENQHGQLLGTVLVKFYARNGKWQPAYRMEDNIALLHDGNQVKPIPTGMGDIELTLGSGTTLPNADGYYTRLEFGVPGKAITIDVWEVQ
jgi:hypothetical protein